MNCTEDREERREHLKRMCLRHASEMSRYVNYHNMITSDKYRYIYCVVDKSSCTSWKRTLLLLDGFHLTNNNNKTTRNAHQLSFGQVHNEWLTRNVYRRLNKFSSDEIDYRLNNYYKFMFVREPLERLISAYRDKILRDSGYLKTVVPTIIRRYRKKHNRSTASSGEVRFLLNEKYNATYWKNRSKKAS